MLILLTLLMPLSPPPVDKAPAIDIKPVIATREAFLTHDGPYWTVGPVLARVRAAMRQMGLTGPVFIRHLPGQGGSSGVSLRHEVGFVLQGDLKPQSPFQETQRPAGRVAFMTLDGRSPKPARDYPAIRTWMDQHGYEHDAEVTEMLEFGRSAAGGSGLALRTRTTEIRVRILSEPPVIAVERNTDRHPEKSAPQPPAFSKTPASPEPTRGPSIPPKQDLEPATTSATDCENGEAPGSIVTLMNSARFDDVADLLLPEGSTIPPNLRVWIGQVVYRIIAAGKGIDRIYPGKGKPMALATEAIQRRYHTVSSGFKVDPLSQAMVRLDAGTDERTAKARKIVADLDSLLGAIATRTADPTSALSTLGKIVCQIESLLRAAEPAAPSTPQ